MQPRAITVVGGGLAGLTLGIGLRRSGVPVVLDEAGTYPRHRVCGEFINGAGLDVLSKLELDDALQAAGARTAVSASFHAGAVAGPVRSMPQPALCLSRHALDRILAEQFLALGGELRTGSRWNGDASAEGVVLASGRRPAPTVGGWKWFGLKAHARGVELASDLEMHLDGDGYVGLCRVERDVVNVCGLLRRRGDGGESSEEWRTRLRGRAGTLLHARLRNAEWVAQSFCAVAGLDLRPKRSPAATGECRVGDALTMIPPFTGNGMSMALESAALATGPLARWSRGAADWAVTRGEIAQRCDAAFASRLRWAKWLHRALFVAPLQPLVARDLLRVERLWRFLHARTR